MNTPTPLDPKMIRAACDAARAVQPQLRAVLDETIADESTALAALIMAIGRQIADLAATEDVLFYGIASVQNSVAFAAMAAFQLKQAEKYGKAG